MASTVKITVEDTSPLISYEPALAWTDSPQNDPLVQQSSASSFRTTSQPGATATFSFSGTGVRVFGSTGPTHGQYAISIDGGAPLVLNGFASTPAVQAPLLSATGLPRGDHTVLITNSPDGQPGALDIDFLVLQTTLGEPVTVDDAQAGSGLQFIPQDGTAWVANGRDFFQGGTSQFTRKANSQMVFNFDGAGIALYGSVSQAHSPYTVSVDGRTTSFTPTTSTFHGQTLLFFDSNLEPGPHQLVMTNNGVNDAQYMDFDFAQVYRAAPSDNTAVGSPFARASDNAGGPQELARPRLSAVVIVGITFGALLGLCILVAVLLFFLKLRKRTRPTFNYPFKGIGGFTDRFKKASSAERGEISAPSFPAMNTYANDTMTQKFAARPAVPHIVTDFSGSNSATGEGAAIKPSPVVALIAHMGSSLANSAGSGRTLLPEGAGVLVQPPAPAAKSKTPARGVPMISSLVTAARNPSSTDKPERSKQNGAKVARKAVPKITSTVSAAGPQRPPVRPPFMGFDPNVKGPERPNRPQTALMLSPDVPVATHTFGEGRPDGGRF